MKKLNKTLSQLYNVCHGKVRIHVMVLLSWNEITGKIKSCPYDKKNNITFWAFDIWTHCFATFNANAFLLETGVKTNLTLSNGTPSGLHF